MTEKILPKRRPGRPKVGSGGKALSLYLSEVAQQATSDESLAELIGRSGLTWNRSIFVDALITAYAEMRSEERHHLENEMVRIVKEKKVTVGL